MQRGAASRWCAGTGSLVYRQGIAEGAPDAVQVSDRSQCAARRGESKEVQDLLSGLSQQPGGS